MKKKNEEVKKWTYFLLSYNFHFTHAKTSILAGFKYIIIFVISLLFNEMQHLKVGWKRPEIYILGQPGGAGGYVFTKKPR